MVQLAFDDDKRPDTQRSAGVDPHARFGGIGELGGERARTSRFRVGTDSNSLGDFRPVPQVLSLYRNHIVNTNDIGHFVG
jgi:hypothetical protein